VTLVSFAGTPIDPSWLAHLHQFCYEIKIVDRDPFAASRLRTLVGRLSTKPTCVAATYSHEMAAQIEQIAAVNAPDGVVALTYVTAPYALLVPNAFKVLDIDNLMTRMLHETHRQTRGMGGRLRSWMAWQKFRRYEQWLLCQFDLCLTVSGLDCQTVARWLPQQPNRISVVPNGVDITYHQPGLSMPEPNTLIYNGALTYQANYDAMEHFLHEIFPRIRATLPAVRVKITGSIEGVPIEKLHTDHHVTFTGFLKDIRPAVAGSWACVVPLRIGAGTRLKILEAMALGTPVVSTSKGVEGLDVEAAKHLLVCDTPDDFAVQTIRLLQDEELRKRLAANALGLVQKRYDWNQIADSFRCTVEQGMGGARPQGKAFGTEERAG
jgi:glycosyltransferase involved in cell wall biosynthesis